MRFNGGFMLVIPILIAYFPRQTVPQSHNMSSLSQPLLPEFTDLPPRQLLVDSAMHEPLRIECKAWPPPPLGMVTYYTVTAMSSATPLHPIASDLLEHNASAIVLSTLHAVRQLSGYELHCLASSSFGSVLSPPFKLVIQDASRSEQPQVQHVLKTRTAAVRCGASLGSTSPTTVRFTLNKTALALLSGKHLVISPNQPSLPTERILLIRNFEPGDEGTYHCEMVDPMTSYSRPSSSPEQQLFIRDGSSAQHYSTFSDFPLVVHPSEASHHPQITVIEGTNLSLVCASNESSTNTTYQITTNQEGFMSPRHRFVTDFGVLFIDRVTLEDEGTYQCSSANWTSTVILRVRPKLRVTITPSVITQHVDDSLFLSCAGSKPFAPFWYHNGRVILSQTSTGSNSSLRIPSRSDSTLGVYQCAQRIHDGDWVSDLAIVQPPSVRVLQKRDFDPLMRRDTRILRFQPTVVSVPLGRTVVLSCIPPNPLDEDNRTVTELLRLFPGQETSVINRIELAQLLGYVRIGWLKDGVSLQLPMEAAVGLLEPKQFELTLMRTHDYGVYECTVYGAVPLFSRETRVVSPHSRVSTESGSNPISGSTQPLPTDDTIASDIRDSLMLESTDRDKRNVLSSLGLKSASFNPRYSNPHSIDPVGDQTGWFNVPMTSSSASSSYLPLGPMTDNEGVRWTKPTALPIGDNLAVNITWFAMQADYYQIRFKHKLPMDRLWSKPIPIDETIQECCGSTPTCCHHVRQFYFTNRQPNGLEPGRLYQFRVVAFMSDETLLSKSSWSQMVSFEHISSIAPVITETERLSDGGVMAHWTLASSAVGFPIDHFLLLYRMEVRQSNGKISYNPFQYVIVPGSDTREFKLQNLEPGKGYQLVVYGVYTPSGLDPHAAVFQGGIGGRKITLFSHEVFVKPQTDDAAPQPLDPSAHLESVATSRKSHGDNSIRFNSNESHQLMFSILGALAGLMLLIMLCLISLCVCRQMRKNSRITYGKSTEKCLASDDRSNYDKLHSRPTNFMLEQIPILTDTAAGVENQKVLSDFPPNRRPMKHASMVFSQPPPFGPAPPPPPRPEHETGTLEMRGIMSDHNTYPQFATASLAHSQFPANHITPMHCLYHPNQLSPMFINAPSQPLPPPPCGMKREPPSGGSVHGGTDTENDTVDAAHPVFRSDSSVVHNTDSMPWAPDVVMNGRFTTPHFTNNPPTLCDSVKHGDPYRGMPTSLSCYLNPLVAHQRPLSHFPPNDTQGGHLWIDSNMLASARPMVHTMQYPHDYGRHFGCPSVQPGFEFYATRQSDLPHLSDVDQRGASHMAHPTCSTMSWYPSPAMTQQQQVHFMYPYTGTDPRNVDRYDCSAQNTGPHPICAQHENVQQLQLAPSHNDEFNEAPVSKRSRRRRFTAEYQRANTPELPAQSVRPLMTSSPIHSESPPVGAVPMHSIKSNRAQHVIGELSGPPPSDSAQNHTGLLANKPLPPLNQLDPNWANCPRIGSHSGPFQGYSWSQGPDISAHHTSFGPDSSSGPLSYGNYNPIASGSFGRRDIVTGGLLVDGPPRVRDYSEYGIPNVHVHNGTSYPNFGLTNTATDPATQCSILPSPSSQDHLIGQLKR